MEGPPHSFIIMSIFFLFLPSALLYFQTQTENGGPLPISEEDQIQEGFFSFFRCCWLQKEIICYNGMVLIILVLYMTILIYFWQLNIMFVHSLANNLTIGDTQRGSPQHDSFSFFNKCIIVASVSLAAAGRPRISLMLILFCLLDRRVAESPLFPFFMS